MLLLVLFSLLNLLCLSFSDTVTPSKTLTLTRAPDFDALYPSFLSRCLPSSVSGIIGWWMEPKFYTYTGDYRYYLRTGGAGSYTDSERAFYDLATESLDTAQSLSVIEEDTQTFFRGLSASAFTSRIISTRYYSDKSYSSTTYDITTALSPIFTSPDAEGFRNVLVLEKRRGESMLYINDVQREFLLPRGSAFNVTDIEEVLNLTVVANFPLFYGAGEANTTAVFEKVRLLYLEPVEPRVVVAQQSRTCANVPDGKADKRGWASRSALVLILVLAILVIMFGAVTVFLMYKRRPSSTDYNSVESLG